MTRSPFNLLHTYHISVLHDISKHVILFDYLKSFLLTYKTANNSNKIDGLSYIFENGWAILG
jgi:hypothetical protein